MKYPLFQRLCSGFLSLVLLFTLTACGAPSATPRHTAEKAKAKAVSRGEDFPTITGTVVYDDTGFRSAVVTVKAGTALAFRNDSSRLLWLDSDDAPEAKVQDPIPSHDQIAYLFQKIGTWHYANRFQSSDHITITVSK